MSASDSGIIILAAPVVLTVGAVSLAAAGITAAAENYRKFRFDRAFAEEMERKAELEFLAGLSDANRQEYEDIIDARITEEYSRKAREDRLKDSLLSRQREEASENDRIASEIQLQFDQMDNMISKYEAEFGEAPSLHEMSDTLHRSREMFGDGKELLKELNDLMFVIIPGMAEEGREKQEADRVEQHLNAIAVENFRIVDTGEEFISLQTLAQETKNPQKTPWERFMERLKAVADVEKMYFETEAEEMLIEAQNLAAGRQNFFIQQNEIKLQEMEDQAEEYRSRQKNISEKTMEYYCMYLAMIEKTGGIPVYTKEDLFDSYAVQDMRDETEAMAEVYKKKRERQYTVNAFSTVMKRHHLQFENMTTDGDGFERLEYSMDEQTGIRITRSESGAFEMQFQGHSKGDSLSLDEKRSITEKAKHFCSLLPDIKKELNEEFGITFSQTSPQTPDIENIEISRRSGQMRREKAEVRKAMQMK